MVGLGVPSILFFILSIYFSHLIVFKFLEFPAEYFGLFLQPEPPSVIVALGLCFLRDSLLARDLLLPPQSLFPCCASLPIKSNAGCAQC